MDGLYIIGMIALGGIAAIVVLAIVLHIRGDAKKEREGRKWKGDGK